MVILILAISVYLQLYLDMGINEINAVEFITFDSL